MNTELLAQQIGIIWAVVEALRKVPGLAKLFVELDPQLLAIIVGAIAYIALLASGAVDLSVVSAFQALIAIVGSNIVHDKIASKIHNAI